MKRRLSILLIAAVALTALTGFFRDRYFDLEWDEEVLLPDGEVIVVHYKTTYERLSQGLTKYGGTNIRRDTTITFDAGGSIGQVTQMFKGFVPLFLGRDGDTWYAVLIGKPYYRSQEVPGQDWGDMEEQNGQRAAKLVGRSFVPISLLELPPHFKKTNVWYRTGSAKNMSELEGKLITLEDKERWFKQDPAGPGNFQIERPKTSKRFPSPQPAEPTAPQPAPAAQRESK